MQNDYMRRTREDTLSITFHHWRVPTRQISCVYSQLIFAISQTVQESCGRSGWLVLLSDCPRMTNDFWLA